MSDKNNTTNMTIEQKMNRLRELTAWFDGEEFELEAAEEKFMQASELAGEIEQNLNKLKNSVTVLKESFEQA